MVLFVPKFLIIRDYKAYAEKQKKAQQLGGGAGGANGGSHNSSLQAAQASLTSRAEINALLKNSSLVQLQQQQKFYSEIQTALARELQLRASNSLNNSSVELIGNGDGGDAAGFVASSSASINLVEIDVDLDNGSAAPMSKMRGMSQIIA
jgi:hypothetical protein